MDRFYQGKRMKGWKGPKVEIAAIAAGEISTWVKKTSFLYFKSRNQG